MGLNWQGGVRVELVGWSLGWGGVELAGWGEGWGGAGRGGA